MEELLMCSICVERYQDQVKHPVLLPRCGHSFCRPCITMISSGGCVVCPTCRLDQRIDSIERLPTQFALLAIIQAQETSKKETCSEHDVKLSFWCKTCCVPACGECLFEDHPTHTHDIIKASKYISDTKESSREIATKFIDCLEERERIFYKGVFYSVKKISAALREVAVLRKDFDEACDLIKTINEDVSISSASSLGETAKFLGLKWNIRGESYEVDKHLQSVSHTAGESCCSSGAGASKGADPGVPSPPTGREGKRPLERDGEGIPGSDLTARDYTSIETSENDKKKEKNETSVDKEEKRESILLENETITEKIKENKREIENKGQLKIMETIEEVNEIECKENAKKNQRIEKGKELDGKEDVGEEMKELVNKEELKEEPNKNKKDVKENTVNSNEVKDKQLPLKLETEDKELIPPNNQNSHENLKEPKEHNSPEAQENPEKTKDKICKKIEDKKEKPLGESEKKKDSGHKRDNDKTEENGKSENNTNLTKQGNDQKNVESGIKEGEILHKNEKEGSKESKDKMKEEDNQKVEKDKTDKVENSNDEQCEENKLNSPIKKSDPKFPVSEHSKYHKENPVDKKDKNVPLKVKRWKLRSPHGSKEETVSTSPPQTGPASFSQGSQKGDEPIHKSSSSHVPHPLPDTEGERINGIQRVEDTHKGQMNQQNPAESTDFKAPKNPDDKSCQTQPSENSGSLEPNLEVKDKQITQQHKDEKNGKKENKETKNSLENNPKSESSQIEETPKKENSDKKQMKEEKGKEKNEDNSHKKSNSTEEKAIIKIEKVEKEIQTDKEVLLKLAKETQTEKPQKSIREIKTQTVETKKADVESQTEDNEPTKSEQDGTEEKLSDCIQVPGFMVGVESVDGRRAPLSWSSQGLHVHSMQDVRFEFDVLIKTSMLHCLIPSKTPKVFLELSSKQTIIGRVYISLWGHLRRSQNFITLCLGDRGPSYVDTNFLQVFNVDGDGERVLGGDYEYNDGRGGKGVIEDLENSQVYSRPMEEGMVTAAGSGQDRTSSLFLICTRSDPSRSFYCPFGMVAEGLNFVREAAQMSARQEEVTVSDCGILLVPPEELMSQEPK